MAVTLLHSQIAIKLQQLWNYMRLTCIQVLHTGSESYTDMHLSPHLKKHAASGQWTPQGAAKGLSAKTKFIMQVRRKYWDLRYGEIRESVSEENALRQSNNTPRSPTTVLNTRMQISRTPTYKHYRTAFFRQRWQEAKRSRVGAGKHSYLSQWALPSPNRGPCAVVADGILSNCTNVWFRADQNYDWVTDPGLSNRLRFLFPRREERGERSLFLFF